MKKLYAARSPEPEAWEAEHTQAVREMTARGAVLMENNGVLPLVPGGAIALYGYGARHTAYCGYGAASINSREQISMEHGLERAGFTVTTKDYLSRYDAAIQAEEEQYFEQVRAVGGSLFDRLVKMYSTQFTPVCQLPVTQQDVENSGTDTAIFVITRISGEGADRKLIPGDYLLSDGEKRNLLFLAAQYKRVVVLLNTVGVIDTSFFKTLPRLGALLLIGLNGGVTGDAAADVLTGRVAPEGKLTATWAENYADYPNADTFGLMDGDTDDERYTEGIYVGYRYFDSFGLTPAYAFGYGLSYTSFVLQTRSVCVENDTLMLRVSVKNTGTVYAGREVVQVYVSCPSGKLDQPAQRLAGFEKTTLLAPQAEQTVTITIPSESLTSYSEKEQAWLLEHGDYIVRVGQSSRQTVPAAILHIESDAVIERCRPFTAACDLETEICADAQQSIFFGEQLPQEIPVILWQAQRKPVQHSYDKRISERAALADVYSGENCTFRQLLDGGCTAESLAASLTDEELALICVGNVPDTGKAEQSGRQLVCVGEGCVERRTGVDIVVGASDTTRALLDKRLLPNMPMADGGGGIRLLPEFEMDENGKLLTAGISAIKNGERLMTEQEKQFFASVPKGERYWQYTTALSMPVVLAQTWDRNCWSRCGEIEKMEMQRFGLKLWLAPGMNIHRNPLGGRNFEYYSEDPLLTGLCAATIIQSLQADGTAGATIKHMACNNQEENRGGMNAHVSERALREIYLKGYEIAIRKARPQAIMTGHNLVNGVNAAESCDLLTAASREEWGFDGLVMTDWGTTTKAGQKTKYGPSDCDSCIRAGTDLIMPGSKEDLREIISAVQSGRLSRRDLRWSAWNILRVMQRLYQEVC